MDFLERLIDLLSKHDEEEMRIRRTLERQLRMNKEKTGELKRRKKR